MGFEPIYILRDRQATTPSSLTSHCLVASTRIELVSNGYQPFALPLSYEAVVRRKAWQYCGSTANPFSVI